MDNKEHRLDGGGGHGGWQIPGSKWGIRSRDDANFRCMLTTTSGYFFIEILYKL